MEREEFKYNCGYAEWDTFVGEVVGFVDWLKATEEELRGDIRKQRNDIAVFHINTNSGNQGVKANLELLKSPEWIKVIT
jgi:hypothetical protein